MVFARDSTVGVGASALVSPNSNGPLDSATAALAAPQVAFTTVATTFPVRSNSVSLAKLQLGLNAFGGILRWVAAPGEQWNILGNAATAGESSLSMLNFGTAAAISSHIVYEPY
jgi:hypothetical protein